MATRLPVGRRSRAQSAATAAGKLLGIALALSQVQATCSYSPPPVLAQGQGADPLGAGRFNAGVEVGYGAAGSWWKATNVGDPDINTDPAGAARLRAGITDDLDVGLVGGVGADDTVVVAPEIKWRFAHLVDTTTDEKAAFHAALVSGLGVGVAGFRYSGGSVGAGSHHSYLAPYSGILVSGGIPVIQMFTGLRLAASQTLGTSEDLTLYPVLAFGVELHVEAVRFFVEGDLAGGYTVVDSSDSAILGCATAGMSITFGRGK
jgi:hypothetical protein